MRNLRRMLCLFLAVLMLTTSALATDIIAPGTGGASPGTGSGGTGSPWSSPTDERKGPGLLLHVETSETVLSFNQDGKAENFKDVVEYWTGHFPNTNQNGEDQQGIYLLPTWGTGYSAAGIQHKPNGNIKYSYNLVSSIQMTGYNSAPDGIKNFIGVSAYEEAAKGLANSKDPNFHLNADYWQNKIAAENVGSCVNIVSQLFSALSSEAGYQTKDDFKEVNERVNLYLGLDVGPNDWDKLNNKEQRDVAMFMNYCGFLAVVIKCLPDDEQADLASQLDNMCQNFLSGKGYAPMVVTGELLVATEYNNDKQFSCWWTPQQCLSAVTGSSFDGEAIEKSTDDPIKAIGVAAASHTKTDRGGLTMYGMPCSTGFKPYSGSSFTLPVFGDLVSSVATEVLTGNGVTYAPIRGFGVWGLANPYTPSIVIPSMEAAANGVIGLTAEGGKEPKAVGGYTETVTVTIPINLETRGFTYSQSISSGAATSPPEVIDASGPGFASTFDWLARKRKEGFVFDNPSINVWLAYADAIPALSDDAATKLIEDSMSYHENGSNPSPTDKYPNGWSPLDGEPAVGASFVWNQVKIHGASAIKLPPIQGLTSTLTSTGYGITLTFNDLSAAAEYFKSHDATLSITVEVPVNGTLDTDSSVNQHWFKSGSNLDMYGPESLDDMNSIHHVQSGLYSRPKYAYVSVKAKPDETPFFYSQELKPFAELKQGTVPVTGGGSSEQFNSMTGTPTFTDTSVRTDFNGTIYENAGRYYQYFASGGSEFVVEFEGKYVENQTAKRDFTINFSTATCNQSTLSCSGHGHGCSSEVVGQTKDGPVMGCTSPCVPAIHMSAHAHTVTTSTVDFSIQYTGLCYIQITDAKVWKLSEARLDGTRELLDQDEVTASVQSVAPSLFYNIANDNTSAQGRMVYDYLPDGAGAGGNADHLVWNFTTPSTCSGSFENTNLQKVQEIIKNSAAATCISDFLVLRTTNGDQSILYYEYRAGEGATLAAGATTSTTSPAMGLTSATVTVTGGAKDAGVKFDHKSYDDLWKNNSQTSEGCGLPNDGITYGGYNGNYSSMDTKYKSSGHASNINLEATTAYKNASGAFKPTPKPTPKLRLLNDTLIIPDYKQNGEYVVGYSEVFYERILNYGTKQTAHTTTTQPQFGNKPGFTIATVYGPTGKPADKINDVVVYNPVSNQNAIVVSLPKERDQRVATHAVPGVDKSAGCPGDSSCPYLKNECTVTEHVHTEACYELLEYEVHGPNNVHEHTAECTYHYSGPNTTGWAHIHCIGGCRDFEGYCTGNRTTCSLCQNNVPFDNDTYPNDSQYQTGGGYYLWYHDAGCQYSGQTHTSTSSTSCTYCGHNCGYLAGNGGEKVYDCNNLPLNKHVCGGSGSAGGSITTGQSKDFNYTGGVQSITLDPGTYKLETWGAQGGSGSGTGGLGGYSTGQITLTSTTTLYVAVGGQGGTDRSTTNGGFNGGGYSVAYGSGGGGATHFATASGTLASLSGNKNAVLIVAGGGGGEAGRSDRPGGAGGGLEGAAGYSGCGGPGQGGTQTAAGASGQNGSAAGFGYGGNQTAFGSNGGAGGGGGYYGGGAGGNDYSSYSDNDDSGGGGGSGYVSASLTAASTTAGSRSGNGYARITAVSVTPTVTCYTMNKALLSCSDPHHAYSYNWKTYTYGLQHTSGRICTGRSCTDTTNLVFPTQEGYTVARCAAGSIVRHANGNVHLTTTTGTCSYCGSTYKEVLSAAQAVDRVPDASEYSCYAYGDPRCWSPCGNNANHQKYVTEIVDNGTTYKMGDFINIDWPFTIYFPNTGDFYGTGAEWSSETSAERGHGYTNGMDATEWTKTKWVEFPFAVVYNNQTFLAYERIYLEVPKTVFEFYVPLHDSEVASAEVKFGSVAINTQNGETLECGANRDHNIQAITYAGKPMAHHHNADKRTYIDVVGRIGNLALNDTGDFRFSNFFKQATSGWIVDNIVHTVDFTKQNNILLDKIDVRGVTIGSTGVAGNTHGTRPERGSIGKISSFPLSPATNNITALQKQPIRVGYDSYFDLTTLGNYYGNTIYDDGGDAVGQNLVLVKPHYYRLDLDSGNYQPVDVYMDVNGNKVLINDNDSNTVAYNGTNAQVNLNWVEEQARRNYTGSEVTNSKAVAGANTWVELPSSSTWVYGNYNLLNLTQRNRTFVGSEYTYVDKGNWVAHKDPSDRLPGTLAALQGARWHFNVGLPSSSVFVYSGQEASQANIDACASGNAVIFCALEIYAQGEVWTLAYDGSNVNQPFTVTPGGKVYDPVIPYPAGKNPKGEEMPIVEIISINHSSKEDLNTSGTQ